MYNESKIIEQRASALWGFMNKTFEDYEIIFFDDGSTDGSSQILEKLALPNVRVEGYEENRGKGCAVRHAMLMARGDIALFTDADLAYGTEVIKQLYDELSEGKADIVIGSRNLSKDGYEGYTLARRLASRLYIKVLGILGGFRLSDSQCGCKAFRRECAHEIFSRCRIDGFAFDFEAILWANQLSYKISEAPVKIINHRTSTVRMFKDSFAMLRDVCKIKKSIKKYAADRM